MHLRLTGMIRPPFPPRCPRGSRTGATLAGTHPP